MKLRDILLDLIGWAAGVLFVAALYGSWLLAGKIVDFLEMVK